MLAQERRHSYSINTGQSLMQLQWKCFDVLPGTYTITVTDANGCISTIPNIVITAALKESRRSRTTLLIPQVLLRFL
jgi:hypothetical protein